MTCPGIHTAAFLVHLSGLWAAMCRACGHFSFFCVATQFVMLCVSIVSSASLALHFMYSIQSSTSSSWLDVLSVSFSNELRCLGLFHRLCCLLLAYLLIQSFVDVFSIQVFIRMMRRSFLRWVVRSIFFVFLVVVQVPAPYVIVGVTTASNRCNFCRK